MAVISRRRRGVDYWPGFVDALASLLMVMVFVILIFTIGQFVLSDALSGRAEQLAALNAGELGVVQLNGRYLLVTAAVLDEAEAIFPQGVALRVDPSAPAGEDPYSDPRYQVPDDLVW